MTKHLSNLCLVAVLLLAVAYQAAAQCPACTVTIPTMPGDTIYLDTFPPAQKNQPYLEELSFRLPYTTTPITALDPSTPGGLDLTSITVTSISGLPLGMSYILDRPLPAVYNEAAPATRDGCVTLCGTPTQSGLFQVLLDVEVLIGGVISQSAQFPLEFLVLPDSSAGFAVNVSQGCDSLWVNFTNNIPSGGNPNFTYDWDFGNGEVSSLENPDSIFYSDTGTYTITYQAIVDTFPSQLTQIVITAATCDDAPFGEPDFYIILSDSSGAELVNNDPNTAPVVGTAPNDQLPDTVWVGQITLEDGATYTIEVWDDDNDIFNADDACGVFNFTPPTTGGTLVDGGNAIEYTIFKFVDTINTTETIVVTDCAISGTGYEQVDNSLRVFPNPTQGLLNVRFHLYGMNADASLQVHDVLGRTIYHENLGNFEGNYNEQIDLSNFDDGVYILTLQVGERISHRKVVLAR